MSITKSNKRNLSRHNKNKNKTNKRSLKHKSMKGGDDGRYVLPMSYFDKGTSGYFATGSPELTPGANQYEVSHGTISKDGNSAGPDLYPMQGGRYKKHRSHKHRSHKRKRNSKSNKK